MARDILIIQHTSIADTALRAICSKSAFRFISFLHRHWVQDELLIRRLSGFEGDILIDRDVRLGGEAIQAIRARLGRGDPPTRLALLPRLEIKQALPDFIGGEFEQARWQGAQKAFEIRGYVGAERKAAKDRGVTGDKAPPWPPGHVSAADLNYSRPFDAALELHPAEALLTDEEKNAIDLTEAAWRCMVVRRLAALEARPREATPTPDSAQLLQGTRDKIDPDWVEDWLRAFGVNVFLERAATPQARPGARSEPGDAPAQRGTDGADAPEGHE